MLSRDIFLSSAILCCFFSPIEMWLSFFHHCLSFHVFLLKFLYSVLSCSKVRKEKKSAISITQWEFGEYEFRNKNSKFHKSVFFFCGFCGNGPLYAPCCLLRCHHHFIDPKFICISCMYAEMNVSTYWTATITLFYRRVFYGTYFVNILNEVLVTFFFVPWCGSVEKYSLY